MIPPWFRALVALQLAGLGVLSVLAIHIASTGSHTPGAVVPWARGGTPAPALDQPRMPTSPSTATASPPRTGAVAQDLLGRLSRDTAALARGEYALLVQLESVIRDQITELANHPPRGE